MSLTATVYANVTIDGREYEAQAHVSSDDPSDLQDIIAWERSTVAGPWLEREFDDLSKHVRDALTAKLYANVPEVLASAAEDAVDAMEGR